MRIVQAIRALQRRVRSIAPVKGRGVVVERTVTGTVISLEEPPSRSRGEDEENPKGMFDIRRHEDEDGNEFIIVGDTSDVAEQEEKDKDGNVIASYPKYAGIPHVNGVAFPQLEAKYAFSGDDTQGLYYIYIHFDASRFLAQEEEKAGTADQDDGGDDGGSDGEDDGQPCEIVICEEQRVSDFENLYYLIGRVRFGKEDGGKKSGKPRYTVEAVTLDHAPGPAYLIWYGPDIGVAEEGEDKEEENT